MLVVQKLQLQHNGGAFGTRGADRSVIGARGGKDGLERRLVAQPNHIVLCGGERTERRMRWAGVEEMEEVDSRGNEE